jgi:hypothetical protein
VSALTEIAGDAWINIAQLGDRLWVSADQREMRIAVELATGETAPDAVARMAWKAALESVPGSTALEVAGATYLSSKCGSVLSGLSAIVAAWTAIADSGQAKIAYLTHGSIRDGELAAELDTRLERVLLDRSRPDEAGPGSPVPVDSVLLFELFDRLNTETVETSTGPAIGTRIQVVAADSMQGVAFFEGTSGACQLTTLQ